jgi:hypothetical protein
LAIALGDSATSTRIPISPITTPLASRRTHDLDRQPRSNISILSVPSGQITGLYKLDVENEMRCIPYLSIGELGTNRRKRGASCYQELQILETKQPYIKQWATPNPLEIVVALRQEQDEPDNIAGFIESLRYGYGHFNEWTKLPAPLFFERVARDYISEFTLEEEEETED